MKSKTYSRRTGFRTWLHGKSVPIDSEQFSAGTPQPSPLAGPAASQTTPTVPPASAFTAGEASLPKVGSAWINKETGAIVDVVGVDGNTVKLYSPCIECDDWVEFVDGFIDEHEEVK